MVFGYMKRPGLEWVFFFFSQTWKVPPTCRAIFYPNSAVLTVQVSLNSHIIGHPWALLIDYSKAHPWHNSFKAIERIICLIIEVTGFGYSFGAAHSASFSIQIFRHVNGQGRGRTLAVQSHSESWAGLPGIVQFLPQIEQAYDKSSLGSGLVR